MQVQIKQQISKKDDISCNKGKNCPITMKTCKRLEIPHVNSLQYIFFSHLKFFNFNIFPYEVANQHGVCSLARWDKGNKFHIDWLLPLPSHSNPWSSLFKPASKQQAGACCSLSRLGWNKVFRDAGLMAEKPKFYSDASKAVFLRSHVLRASPASE